MKESISSMRPPSWRRLRTGSEQALVRTVNHLAYAAGYGVGLLRHRYLQSLSLFHVLGELSRGVSDAAAGRSVAGSCPEEAT